MTKKELLDKIFEAYFTYESTVKLDNVDVNRELIKFAKTTLPLIDAYLDTGDKKKGNNKMIRYTMCQNQPAQIDCRNTKCESHDENGHCINISPAITLNPNGSFVCWSRKE